MAPVTARVVLACPDADGRPVTHLLAFGEHGDWEIVRDSRISMSRTFRATAVVRAACRDERGRLTHAHSHTVVAVDGARERAAIIDRVNAERARNGVGALAHDTGLDVVAAAHARDMAERGYFSHVSPEGWDLAARLERAQRSYRGAAENLAGNQTPRLAVQAWLDSPGHRENLLSQEYDRTGVGVYRTPSSPYTYYVQVFAR